MNNTITIFNDLFKNRRMNFAKEVILSGGSAGGFAAFMWADYLKNLFP
jgi:hypothetical protein